LANDGYPLPCGLSYNSSYFNSFIKAPINIVVDNVELIFDESFIDKLITAPDAILFDIKK